MYRKIENSPRMTDNEARQAYPDDSTTMAQVEYKVDTGANCTTISKKRLAELGYDENRIKSGKLLTGSERPTAATGLPVSV
ncbi:MAG: hypothetical protein FWF79_05285 [Defluviitaleaceae bacterium]|nr:hypothetical protein [Defluviitaleaceae bacterium]